MVLCVSLGVCKYASVHGSFVCLLVDRLDEISLIGA